MRTDLVDAFRKMVGKIIADYPDLQYHKTDKRASVKLEFQKASGSGFNIVIEVSDNDVYIGTDCGWACGCTRCF